MSDLDKKLYKILKEVDSEDRFDENFINLQALFVKKAFIDGGWLSPESYLSNSNFAPWKVIDKPCKGSGIEDE